MVAFLLKRPVAVGMSLTALLAMSLLALYQLPVSLLPDTDVPYLTITVRYPNSPAEEIEQNILLPIREQLLSVNNLKSIESEATGESGRLILHFAYGSDMQLAYMEVNEKIDRLTSRLPRNLERPPVVKSATSDIPIARIQIIPPAEDQLVEVSELTRFTLKRRIEQLEGVGLVDMNGLRSTHIVITPDYARLTSLNLTDADIEQAVRNANLQIGSLTVRNGNYRYFLKLSATVTDPHSLGFLPLRLPEGKGVVRLHQVADVRHETEPPTGHHLFNGRHGLVLTVHKQAQANMSQVMKQIYHTAGQFKADFPHLHIEVIRDQSALLNLSIENLTQALVWGGAFAFAVLFLFMGNWREPLMMGIVLPVSLLLSFGLLYLFNLPLSIISLSGLALGMGMLVDNSIVVVDNISLRRKQGDGVFQACVSGTHEVMLPLISSALTNLAVFVPLIFMSGLTGTLFYHQALAVIAILSVSLACTFILVPLLYKSLYQNRNQPTEEDSRMFIKLREAYHRSFDWVWKHKTISLTAMVLLIPVAVVLVIYLPKSGFPEIERTETLWHIDWNEPIDVNESAGRIRQLADKYASALVHSEAEIGHQQFMLGTGNPTARQVTLYLHYPNGLTRQRFDRQIENYLSQTYPMARFERTPAPNAFEQLFTSSKPYYEARFRQPGRQPISDSLAQVVVSRARHLGAQPGKGFLRETTAQLTVNLNKMKTYGVAYEEVLKALRIAFGVYPVTTYKDFGRSTTVVLSRPEQQAADLNALTVKSTSGNFYPVSEFVALSYHNPYQYITADASGNYQSVEINTLPDEPMARQSFLNLAAGAGLVVDFSGQWFDDRETLLQLSLILMVSVLLVYFILTAEFESFRQPLLVMLSLPIGLAGSLLLLWFTGGSINVMSGIGLVVVLGILDNDAILKIDRINRLRKHLPLEQAIRQAGQDRLKAIVMNTCTNVLAVTPILFASGLGAELQQPVAVTSIGGLIAATFTALYFVPLLYSRLHREKQQ